MSATDWYHNATGTTILKGSCVSSSSTDDRGVVLSPAGDASPVGVARRDIPDGQWGEVVVQGQVEVLIDNQAGCSRDWWLEVSPAIAGLARASASPPGLVLQHFNELGHTHTARGNPGLVWASVHFN